MQTATTPQPSQVKVLMLDPMGAQDDWCSRFNDTGRQWDVVCVNDSNALIASLKELEFQAVMVASSAAIQADNDCFIRAMALQPQAVRILLQGMPLNVTQMSHALDLVHRVFGEECSMQEIVAGTEYLIRVNRLIFKQKTRDYVLSLGQLPSPPQVYQELNQVLGSERSNASHIGAVIGKDPALAAKVLKVVNSAYFRLDRQISSIREAVTLLGIRMLRTLSLSGHLVSLYPEHRNWSYFSFERINQRAVQVGHLAQQICHEMNTSQATQDQALVAGLLHDLGLLVFASQDPQSYRKVMVMSAQKNTPLCVVEKKMLGLFHGEVAAFLLAQWKLPAAIVEAVLLHHTPQLSASEDFTPLAAVHIADALLPQAETEIGANLANSLSLDYLKRLGVSDRLPHWQASAKRIQQMEIASGF